MADEPPTICTERASDTLSLEDILDTGQALPTTTWPDVDGLLPAAAAECVKKVAARKGTLAMQGQDWIVDEQLSRARGGSRRANPYFPCLLQSCKHPPWIGSRCRRATVAEACRAQGLPPAMITPGDWGEPIAMCHMLGNRMTTNVLLRVLVPLIHAARPDVNTQDPWSTGHAQHILRRSARAAGQ